MLCLMEKNNTTTTNNLNVYIATLPRSGSTILGLMLNQHPSITHMGESSYWGKLEAPPIRCSCGLLSTCPFILDIYNKMLGDPNIKSIYNVCAAIDKLQEPNKVYHSDSLPNYRTKVLNHNQFKKELKRAVIGLDRLAQIYRNKTNKSMVVDNTKCVEIAEELVKQKKWKVIIMLRDPRGIAFSNKESGKRKKVPRSVISKIPIFINFMDKVKKLSKERDTLVVSYENLCENTKETLDRICNFLSIPYEEDMLKFNQNRGHLFMGNRLLFNENLDTKLKQDNAWKNGLNKKELGLIEGNINLVNLYKEFNYFK